MGNLIPLPHRPDRVDAFDGHVMARPPPIEMSAPAPPAGHSP